MIIFYLWVLSSCVELFQVMVISCSVSFSGLHVIHERVQSHIEKHYNQANTLNIFIINNHQTNVFSSLHVTGNECNHTLALLNRRQSVFDYLLLCFLCSFLEVTVGFARNCRSTGLKEHRDCGRLENSKS